MEFRSLRQPEGEGGSSVTRLEAQIFSVGLHLLILLLALYLPGALPTAVVEFFSGTPRPLTRPEESAPPPPAAVERPKPLQIPLKYAYLDPSVRVPNDRAVKENPDAPILSNRNREARQEVPTPPDANRLSIDPHSRGDTIHRARPDPDRPEGPEVAVPTDGDTPETSPRETERSEAEALPARGTDAVATGAVPGRGGNGPSGAANGSGPAAGIATGEQGPKGPPPGTGPGGAAGPGSIDAAALDELVRRAGERLRESLRDVQSGEFKYTFHNPAYLRSGAYGTMSFDTKEFPWGDYARLIYVRVGNNWRERIPSQPFSVGTRGYTCQYFTIERDGTVSRVITVKPSLHPSYTRAAGDAINASSPLPPLPKGFPSDREGVTYCFYYNMFPGEAE